MSTQLRHVKFLNEHTYFRAQNRFNQDAQRAVGELLDSPELAEIKAKCPKDK